MNGVEKNEMDNVNENGYCEVCGKESNLRNNKCEKCYKDEIVNNYETLKQENERLNNTISRMADFIGKFDLDEDLCKKYYKDVDCEKLNRECKKCIIKTLSKVER